VYRQDYTVNHNRCKNRKGCIVLTVLYIGMPTYRQHRLNILNTVQCLMVDIYRTVKTMHPFRFLHLL